jgi:hypothetical protein
MEHDCDIAAPKLSESNSATVERDDRRLPDREPDPAPIELAEHEPGWSNPEDQSSIGRLGRGCAGRREDQRDTEHRPESPHETILCNPRQSPMCRV